MKHAGKKHSTQARIVRKMILKEIFYFLSLTLFLGSTSFLVAISAPIQKSHADTRSVEADNSKINQRDAQGTNLTPEDQSLVSAADVEMTRKIRESLTRDSALSTNAKNIKIITLKGVTTLRGPVNSPEEKLAIDRIAKNLNTRPIDNKLEVIRK